MLYLDTSAVASGGSVTWTVDGGSSAVARYAVLYQANTSKLIYIIDLGAAIDLSAESLTINGWSSGYWLTFAGADTPGGGGGG